MWENTKMVFDPCFNKMQQEKNEAITPCFRSFQRVSVSPLKEKKINIKWNIL